MKTLVCVVILGFVSAFAKTDTLIVVNCKCDTLRIVKTTDTTVTVKLDTLKHEKKFKK
jgi:hypothetical protein